MKLKCRPEDFRVEELLSLKLAKRGRYSVYRLEKRYWNTLDVIRELESKHRFRRIGRAGLKDRYSHSIQYLSIAGTGPAAITEKNWRLTLAGMANEPVTRDAVSANRFTITLRSLDEAEVETALAALPQVRSSGLANYYDEQRFGSGRSGQGFIGRRLLDGHYHGALKLLLATPSAADDSSARRRHEQALAHWGDWREVAKLAPPEARPAVEHLTQRHSDFKGAVKLLPRPLLELFLNAYQSWLFNEILCALFRKLGIPTREVEYSQGKLAFYRTLLPDQLRYLDKLEIPVPGPGAEFSSDRVAAITTEVLAREGLELEDMKLGLRVRGLYFKPYPRRALVRPGELRSRGPADDDLYPGKQKLELGFTLPPGSYATILVKRLLV